MNTNNKIPATDSTLKNDNLSKVTKSYVFYVLIAGILTLLPVVELISEVIATLAPNLELSNKIYAIAFYAVKVFGVLIYFFALKEKTIPKIIFALIAGIFLLLNGLAYSNLSNMESGGLDSLGQTLGYVMIYRICLYIYYAFTFTLFILHARNFLFKKKVLVSILIAIASAILLVFTYNIVSRFGATLEVNTTSKTVNDFKNELLARNLYADENILLGINSKGEHLNLLDFDSNSNEKYPSYIYYGYITKSDIVSSDEN